MTGIEDGFRLRSPEEQMEHQHKIDISIQISQKDLINNS